MLRHESKGGPLVYSKEAYVSDFQKEPSSVSISIAQRPCRESRKGLALQAWDILSC